MVFEHLFPDAVLERKEWTGFFLAAIYSTIAIVIARFLFPANSGLVSVVFVSIFLLPYFSTILKREEQQEEGDASKSFLGLLRDNADVISVYVAIFLGIYLTFMLYTFLMPAFGSDVGDVFREQLSLEGVRGSADLVANPLEFSGGLLVEIFVNNWWVLLACFLVSLVAGDGAVFFIAWTASTWGAIFGYRAFAAGNAGWDPWLALLIIVLVTLPHLILEGGAYILAAIAGGVISDEIVQRSGEVQTFVAYFLGGAVLFWAAYLFVTVLADSVLIRGLFAIAIALGILHLLQFLFSNERERRVFRYNYYLFGASIAMFFIGALVETLILVNVMPLRAVYAAAFMGG